MQIEAIQPCGLSAKDGGGNEEAEDHQKEKELHASRDVIEIVYIGLPEETENIIKKMGKNGAEQGACGIKGQSEDCARKEIDGQIGKIKVEQGKEQCAEGNCAGNASYLVFPTEDSAKDKFLAKSGNYRT